MAVLCLYGDLNGVSLTGPALKQYYDEGQEQEDVENLVYYG